MVRLVIACLTLSLPIACYSPVCTAGDTSDICEQERRDHTVVEIREGCNGGIAGPRFELIVQANGNVMRHGKLLSGIEPSEVARALEEASAAPAGPEPQAECCDQGVCGLFVEYASGRSAMLKETPGLRSALDAL